MWFYRNDATVLRQEPVEAHGDALNLSLRRDVGAGQGRYRQLTGARFLQLELHEPEQVVPKGQLLEYLARFVCRLAVGFVVILR